MRLISLSSRYASTLASPDPSPEELCADKEELEKGLRVEKQYEPAARKLTDREIRILQSFLPREEAYLLDAYYLKSQAQSTIGYSLGTVRQSIQHRLQRAILRIRWATALETWHRSSEQIVADLGDCLSGPLLALTCALWAHRWNQTKVAKDLRIKQRSVRAQVLLLRDKLAEIGLITSATLPYLRDLDRVISQRAWCIGKVQKQGKRAIPFYRLGLYGENQMASSLVQEFVSIQQKALARKAELLKELEELNTLLPAEEHVSTPRRRATHTQKEMDVLMTYVVEHPGQTARDVVAGLEGTEIYTKAKAMLLKAKKAGLVRSEGEMRNTVYFAV